MPEGEQDRNWQRVSIPSPTGATLVGLVAEAEGDPAGTLVLAHPMGKAAKGFWLRHGHAELFRRAGFHVLVFDFNGFGESEAVSFDYPSDALAAGRFTPPAHGERVLRAMNGRARADLWVLPGVEHTFAYRDQREAYAARVVPFLRNSLTN
jgi:pimeloyl-ACP methyl ester carboxylesterase